MVDMIATKKLKYGTRRLTAGDPFEARHDRDARLLIGIGKARYATRTMVADDEPVAPALTIPSDGLRMVGNRGPCLRSEEHTSELQSLMRISYAVFCLKKKNKS